MPLKSPRGTDAWHKTPTLKEMQSFISSLRLNKGKIAMLIRVKVFMKLIFISFKGYKHNYVYVLTQQQAYLTVVFFSSYADSTYGAVREIFPFTSRQKNI